MKPALPPVSSWYPGHMATFAKTLPVTLKSAHVVLEARDARMPLSSINTAFEDEIKKWQKECGVAPAERIVVYTKSDLVPAWGIKPFAAALKKHLDQFALFTTVVRGATVGVVHAKLVDIARKHQLSTPELRVLVLGMPNVGKSSLLNHLRRYGIQGASASPLRTSRLPGMTRAMSTRLKLNLDPPIYSIDSPGVMIPFLGYGERAKERGLKLALISGIKEDLYDYEDLTPYLLYRLTSINPSCRLSFSRASLSSSLWPSLYLGAAPPFPDILQRPPRPPTHPPADFLDGLATRLKAVLPGGIPDRQRAARWFVEWWREARLRSPSAHAIGTPEWGWTFDCIWQDDFHCTGAPVSAFSHPLVLDSVSALPSDHRPSAGASCVPEPSAPGSVRSRAARLEERFDRTLADYAKQIRDREVIESQTQARKRVKLEENRKREAKRRIRAVAKYSGRVT